MNTTTAPRPGDTLIGLPTVGRILGVTRETARTYAFRGLFATRQIDGRLFGVLADVLRLKAEREQLHVASRRRARTRTA